VQPGRNWVSLLDYCRAQEWQGYDPYDGLNSPLVRLLPSQGGAGKLARMAWTQLVKRSPINFRPLVGIKKGLNPKGLALFARALLLFRDTLSIGPNMRHLADLDVPGGFGLGQDLASAEMAGRAVRDFDDDLAYLMGSLSALRTPGYKEACWGYNFDWQSRAFFAAKGTPNVVCTVFAASAFLDRFERSGTEKDLAMAVSSCRFLLDRINRTERDKSFCFSYTPADHAEVHNVNLLAAELLARVYAKTGDDEYADAATRSTCYSVSRQRSDGSWIYGESRSQQWIDSFHTGFILISLKRLIECLGVRHWNPSLSAGYEFYSNNFFLADSAPKYYHDRFYPLDIHSAAVAVAALAELGDRWPDGLNRAEGVMRWAVETLQAPGGFFYYQARRFYRVKTSYIRWAQAWMLYAMGVYFARSRVTQNG
jgi:hypothetical protein